MTGKMRDPMIDQRFAHSFEPRLIRPHQPVVTALGRLDAPPQGLALPAAVRKVLNRVDHAERWRPDWPRKVLAPPEGPDRRPIDYFDPIEPTLRGIAAVITCGRSSGMEW